MARQRSARPDSVTDPEELDHLEANTLGFPAKSIGRGLGFQSDKVDQITGLSVECLVCVGPFAPGAPILGSPNSNTRPAWVLRVQRGREG
jgi:hypothetical protein